MSSAKALEHDIVRQALNRRTLHRRDRPGARLEPGGAERLIRVLAATAGLFLVGAVLGELLWAIIAAATVVSLGMPES